MATGGHFVKQFFFYLNGEKYDQMVFYRSQNGNSVNYKVNLHIDLKWPTAGI